MYFSRHHANRAPNTGQGRPISHPVQDDSAPTDQPAPVAVDVQTAATDIPQGRPGFLGRLQNLMPARRGTAANDGERQPEIEDRRHGRRGRRLSPWGDMEAGQDQGPSNNMNRRSEIPDYSYGPQPVMGYTPVQRPAEPYVPVDPFKPSIAQSVQNVIFAQPEGQKMDNIIVPQHDAPVIIQPSPGYGYYSNHHRHNPPVIIEQTESRRYDSPSDFSANAGGSRSRSQSRSRSRRRHSPVMHSRRARSRSPMYETMRPIVIQGHGRSRSRSRSRDHRSRRRVYPIIVPTPRSRSSSRSRSHSRSRYSRSHRSRYRSPPVVLVPHSRRSYSRSRSPPVPVVVVPPHPQSPSRRRRYSRSRSPPVVVIPTTAPARHYSPIRQHRRARSPFRRSRSHSYSPRPHARRPAPVYVHRNVRPRISPPAPIIIQPGTRSSRSSRSPRRLHSPSRSRSRRSSRSSRSRHSRRSSPEVIVQHSRSRSRSSRRSRRPSPIVLRSPRSRSSSRPRRHRRHPRTRSSSRSPSVRHAHPHIHQPSYAFPSQPYYNVPRPQAFPTKPTFYTAKVSARSYIYAFCLDTLPRQLYLHLLLRLPRLYFSRVTRIFEEAELSMPEIKKMALETANQGQDLSYGLTRIHQNPPAPYANLKSTWEMFIDSLMREWKTLNIISVLLLSAILTILQIQSAAADPLTRYSALLSLICAMMSLLYGCMYIIRFGSMRKTHKAAEWAAEAQKTKTMIVWNVWVLLAMPATWLAWSIILYIVCIMSFVWRTGITSDEDTIPTHEVLWPRIVISAVLGVGCLYFILIMSTFRHYGDAMDRRWRNRIRGWTLGQGQGYHPVQMHPIVLSSPTPSHSPHIRPSNNHHRRNSKPEAESPDQVIIEKSTPSPSFRTASMLPQNRALTSRSNSPPGRRPELQNTSTHSLVPIKPRDMGHVPDTFVPSLPTSPAFNAIKATDLFDGTEEPREMAAELRDRGLTEKDWRDMIIKARTIYLVLEGHRKPEDKAIELLQQCNTWDLYQRGLCAIVCEEHPTTQTTNSIEPDVPRHALYVVDISIPLWDGFEPRHHLKQVATSFGPVPEGLDRVDVLGLLQRRSESGSTFFYLERVPLVHNQGELPTRLGGSISSVIYSDAHHGPQPKSESSSAASSSSSD